MEINYIDQRPEISIVDDTVILSLTLQDNAASTAINAANEAEASALAAGLSEQNALDSEQAAAQSESNAAGSATAASQSASNALASEQNAAQSETNAATSASTATTQAGIATAKASEASQSATDALASAQAAAASELDAEAARDEIVSKIDFTGAQEGDIYRVNNAGVAVRVNETEFLKSKVPFLNSPLAGLVDLNNAFAWDSFSRPNSNNLGTTDNGVPWINLGSLPGDFGIIDNSAYLVSPNVALNNFKVVDLLSAKTFVKVTGSIRRSLEGAGFVIATSDQALYYLKLGTNVVQLIKIFAGVLTIVKTVTFHNTLTPLFTLEFTIIKFGTRMGAFITINNGVVFSPTDLDVDTSQFTEIRYAGIYQDRSSSRILNVLIQTV